MDSKVYFDEEILDLIGIDEVRKEEWDKYTFDKIGNVPRVTNILKQCRNNDGLMQWAANVGRYKYQYYRDKALNIGTIVHELIDNYLCYNHPSPNLPKIDNINIDYQLYEADQRSSIFNSYTNFTIWEENLNKLGYSIEEVLTVEYPLVCPLFGGTCDAIFKINGIYYVIDFKTSKSISPEYLLQVSAYMWVINNYYIDKLPHVSGAGIIRVDKSRLNVVDDLFLNEYDPYQKFMITSYQQCFISYAEAFYRTISTDYITNTYEYNKGEVLNGNNDK